MKDLTILFNQNLSHEICFCANKICLNLIQVVIQYIHVVNRYLNSQTDTALADRPQTLTQQRQERYKRKA
jgi:hypothetical protein